MLTDFNDLGNKELTDQVNHIQLAVIKAVDVKDMMADIEWLGSKGGKTRVALAQPMAGPGYGIYCIPKRGTVCAIGLRAMQIPLILAYLPMNVSYPHSFFSQMREEFSMVGDLAEGDIFMRALSDIAKCDNCGETSTLRAWEAAIDTETLNERCPKCKIPAVERDPGTGQVTKIRKINFGTTIHMRANGTTEFQLNNQADKARGDTERLLKIIITPDSGMEIRDAGDIAIHSNKTLTFDCQDIILNARDSINQRSTNRSSQVSAADAETYISKSMTATENMNLKADIMSIVGTTLLSQEAKVRQAKIEGEDVEEVGSKILKASKTIQILSTEDMNIESNKAMVLKAANDMAIDAANIILQGGDKAVSRVDDTTLADSSTDGPFFTFLSNIFTALTTSPTVVGDGGAAYKAGIVGILTGPAPTKLDGKITSGNDKVKA